MINIESWIGKVVYNKEETNIGSNVCFNKLCIVVRLHCTVKTH